MNSVEKVRYLIDHNNFMVIATANASGKPWISPVGFAYDQYYNLYWVSSKEAVHSENIRQRSEVAISIFGQMPDNSFDGVYFDALAEELEGSTEIEAGMKLFRDQRPQPSRFVTTSIADVTGEAAWRMYKARPVAVYKRADDTLRGQAVTVREQVHL